MIELEPALKALTEKNVEFVIIGGIAISAHGSAYITKDLDFCDRRTKENLENIVLALEPYNPRPRGFPENLPFVFDRSTLQNETNFTFTSDLGDIDLLGEVAGVGTFAEAKASSQIINLLDFDVSVLSIEGLIKAKHAAGRTKDLLVLPELEALLEALSDEEE